MAVEMAQKYVSELERIADARQKRISEHTQELREVRKAIAKELAAVWKLTHSCVLRGAHHEQLDETLAEMWKLVYGTQSAMTAFTEQKHEGQVALHLAMLITKLGVLTLAAPEPCTAQGAVRLMALHTELGALMLQRIHLQVEICHGNKLDAAFPANLEAAQARLAEAQAALDALNGDSEANS